MLSGRLLGIAVLALMLVTACRSDTTSTTTSRPDTTATVAATTTSPAPTSTTELQGDTVTVLLYPFDQMGPGWDEQVFRYGDNADKLGTAPGGDGLMLGPEYGTQLADGTWWFMDAAKQRLAHFDASGSYIGQVEVPPEVLVDGLYFQFQNPIGLDDGRIFASGFRGETGTSLLIMEDDEIDEATIRATVPWVTTDGTRLFGFSVEDGGPVRLRPSSLAVAGVKWFRARDGSRYMVTVGDSEVVVDLPDAGVTKTLQLRFSEDPETAARAGIEVETGVDGSLFILFYGSPTSDESLGIGGLVRISPDGHVGDSEPVVDPFTPADPGSPSHLGVTPGTSNPWLMVIGEDGVHVHTSG